MLLFFIIAILAFAVQWLLPWQSMVVIAFVAAFLMAGSKWHAFLSGFLACGLVWLAQALFIHFTRGSLMTEKIADLLTLSNSALLYPAVFLMAALAGGLSALSGKLLRDIFGKHQTTSV